MVTKMKHAGETQSVVRAVDETIANLTQMRPILGNPVMLALIKKIVGNPASSIRAEAHSPNASTRPNGSIVRAAFEIVRDMDDTPFTKRDLGEKLRQNRYEMKNPRSSAVFYATRQLVADKMIERIEQGGGSRPDVYQRIDASRTEEASLSIEHTEGNDIDTSASAIPRQLRLRNGMEPGSPSGFNVNVLFSGAWRKTFVHRTLIRLAETSLRGLAHG